MKFSWRENFIHIEIFQQFHCVKFFYIVGYFYTEIKNKIKV